VVEGDAVQLTDNGALEHGTDSGSMKCATARFTTKTAAPHSCFPSGPRRS
jgi:hypothetical protein